MAFHVQTTVFEGPLDLLLQLITKHQVEVTAVGLTEVVGEYLSFLEEMKQLDLEVTSEFLLIAATLIQLKAQSLLPNRGELDIDEEFDRWFLSQLESGDLDDLLAMPNDELMLAGNGTGEVRSWVAVAAAMHGRGAKTLAYEPIYEWITGMGVIAHDGDAR